MLSEMEIMDMDQKELLTSLKQKMARVPLSFTKIAQEIGTSSATLMRFINGIPASRITCIRIQQWINKKPVDESQK